MPHPKQERCQGCEKLVLVTKGDEISRVRFRLPYKATMFSLEVRQICGDCKKAHKGSWKKA